MIPPLTQSRADVLLGAAPLPPGGPLGLYVHVPFCAHICPYCDFNTYVGQESLIPRYVAALTAELRMMAPAVAGREVASVYFGGGTPSLLRPEQCAALLAACEELYNLVADAEITLEANPNGLTADYLTALRQSGINRLSLGAQTLDRRGLRTLGRMHEATDVLSALAAARGAGFANISVDLIFGWPGQTLSTWERDLMTLVGGGGGPRVDHLSLYSLIIEPGTPYADAVTRGILQVVADDLSADMYELAIDLLGAAGFIQYEVANWARAAPYESRHNRLYWLNGEYLGIGAGAHGYLAGARAMNHLLPRQYCAALEAGVLPRSNAEQISPAGAMGETMMLGLRLPREGVSRLLFAGRHGVALDAVYGEVLSRFAGTGLIIDDGETLRLSSAGLLLANDVCAEFLVDPGLAATPINVERPVRRG